jgi:hypothetical protein
MTLWGFESGAIPSYGEQSGMFYRIELVDQDVSVWPLPAFSPSSTLNGCKWVFAVPKIKRLNKAETGSMAVPSISLECTGEYVRTDGINVASGNLVPGVTYQVVGYTTVTYNSVVRVTGERFRAVAGVLTYTTAGTGTVERAWTVYDILTDKDRYTTDIHCIIYSRAAVTDPWTGRFWGTVDFEGGVSMDILDPDNPETWTIAFTAKDCVLQLERRTVEQFTADLLTSASYDYTVTNDTLFTTFYGTSNATWKNAAERQAGAYLLTDIYVDDGVNKYWLHSQANGSVRFFKIVDIFEAIADYMGLTLAVNNGSAWSNHHTWDFKYNSATTYLTGSNSLQTVGIDSLYIFSSWRNGSNQKATWNTHFGENKPPHSFAEISVMDMLKKLCYSFGLTARIEMDSSLVRYLSITEAGRVTLGLNASLNPELNSDIKMEYNSKTLHGVEVVSPHGQNMQRGAVGNSSIKVDCMFGTCGGLRFDDPYARLKMLEFKETSNYRHINATTADRNDLFSSLWVLTNLTAKNAAQAWSICVIKPKNDTQVAASDPGNIPAYGEFSTGVQYPNGAQVASNNTNSESTTLAMALAHYYFNDVSFANDPVGVYRPQGELISFKVNTLPMGTIYQPIIEYGITLNGVDHVAYVDEIEEDLEEGSYTISGSTLAS